MARVSSCPKQKTLNLSPTIMKPKKYKHVYCCTIKGSTRLQVFYKCSTNVLQVFSCCSAKLMVRKEIEKKRERKRNREKKGESKENGKSRADKGNRKEKERIRNTKGRKRKQRK